MSGLEEMNSQDFTFIGCIVVVITLFVLSVFFLIIRFGKKKNQKKAFWLQFIAFLTMFSFIITILIILKNIPVLAIVVSALFFIVTSMNQIERDLDKQIQILKQIKEEVIDLLDKEDGHIKFFEDSISSVGYPHHNMNKLSQNNLNVLAPKVNYYSTSKIKRLVRKANDKINMLNGYRKTVKTWKKVYKFESDKRCSNGRYLNEVIGDLKGMLVKIKMELIKFNLIK